MASPYRVGIELSLVNNFSAAFAVVLREIAGGVTSVKTLEAAINRLSPALISAGSMMAGW
jgi:hypothetical protein